MERLAFASTAAEPIEWTSCDASWSEREALVALVAERFAVSPSELNAPTRRSAAVAFARQAAMYLAHVSFQANYTEIGRALAATARRPPMPAASSKSDATIRPSTPCWSNSSGRFRRRDRPASLANTSAPESRGVAELDPKAIAELSAADLIAQGPDGAFEITRPARTMGSGQGPRRPRSVPHSAYDARAPSGRASWEQADRGRAAVGQ